MKKTVAPALLLAALALTGCQPDAALKKGEVIDNGVKPINQPTAKAPTNPQPAPAQAPTTPPAQAPH